MNNEATNYKKDEALRIWENLPDNQELNPESIPYKHKGTTIDQDGIRICGTQEFIFAVLSRIKPLLEYENGNTRIGIAFSQIQDKETKMLIPDKYRCSVQVHERGPQAQWCNAICAGAKERQAARKAQIDLFNQAIA